MSEITKENVDLKAELESQELPLEKKIENHTIEAESETGYDNEDFEKVLRKKDQLLNEKKRVQRELEEMRKEHLQLKNMMKRQEEEKLEEKQEYKKLWEATQEELRLEREQRLEQEQKIVKSQKRKAIDRELGKPLSKERYYDFVNFEDVIVEADGTVNSESVRYAVNLFRKNYPELVPVTQPINPGSEAPSNDGIIRVKKGLTDMKGSERSNLKNQLLRSRK